MLPPLLKPHEMTSSCTSQFDPITLRRSQSILSIDLSSAELSVATTVAVVSTLAAVAVGVYLAVRHLKLCLVLIGSFPFQ